MAARSEQESEAVKFLPASPLYRCLIKRILSSGASSQEKKKWAVPGDGIVSKLLRDLATSLAPLVGHLEDIEQAAAMSENLASRLFQVGDAACRLDDLLDEIEYGSLETGLCTRSESEVRLPRHLPIFCSFAAFCLGRRDESPRNQLLEEFAVAVAKSRDLIARLARDASSAPNPPILALDSPERIAAAVPPVQNVFGREADRNNIVESLLVQSSYRLSVIPVFGTSGLGKTTLARLVYNDTRVAQHFDVRIWVSVSSGFNKTEITRDILRSADPGYGDRMAKADIQTLQSELCHLVAPHRFLLVLDDLWDQNNMDPLGKDTLQEIFAPLQSAEMGSSVLVTTPVMAVAEALATSQPYILGKLCDNECAALFLEYALSGRNRKTCLELEQRGRGIADKLEGLPLAAKVLGVLLGAISSTDEWRSIVERRISGNAALHSVQLSYDCLPAQLKQCFAYCALFPKNWKFDRTKLIHLWMAEGFIGPQGNADKRMEDLGSEYFDALISLSFFHGYKQGPKTYYLMHHLFHDLAEAVSTNLCYRIDAGLTAEIPKTVRHLSVTTDSLLDLNTCCTLENLRSLVVLRSPWHSFQDDHLMKLSNLRVLDLSGCILTELPKAIDHLTHLRYLSLCGTLRQLPESLSRLLHLQTLCFPENCSLDKLPTGTTNLVNLRYLDIDTKYIAQLVSIRRMVNLQGSVELDVGKEGHALEDLRNIKGLRGQLKICGLDNVLTKEEARRAGLNNKKYLKVLKLEWSSVSRNPCRTAHDEVLESLHPHPNIEELVIRRYCGSTAPSWLKSPLLKNLQSLHLINCRNLSILPPLGQLPSLEQLHMKELCAVNHIGHEFYSSDHVAFPCLKVLELVDFPRLLEWSAGVNIGDPFPCLKILRLINCPKLERIPLLPPTTIEVMIESICFMTHLRLAPLSSSSLMLSLDTYTTTVLCKRLFHQQHLESITVLNINGDKQLAASEGLGFLCSLQKLKLCRCDMMDYNFSLFLQALPSLSSLEMIDLPNITTLPVQADLSFCARLTELHIYNCPLLSSLSSLQAFISLEWLEIERCPKLTAASFPIQFGNLVSLKVLSISYCSQFQSLPTGGLPSSLEALNLIGCHPTLIDQSRNRTADSWKKVATMPKILIR